LSPDRRFITSFVGRRCGADAISDTPCRVGRLALLIHDASGASSSLSASGFCKANSISRYASTNDFPPEIKDFGSEIRLHQVYKVVARLSPADFRGIGL
jgi:hypothetical protein